ncbi:fatty acid--CoA ligase [Streptomyces alkaliterrae]|uniref:Fatty acid--CoA ligase n=1 Tax=Streptomyces alkaliterrae TaxID=2213162 RepID=A0A5P0YN98_9ACTN|nr:fatty acid--CoA ligase [Streptomyces alkaliterrae]MBB1253531.1 fatty acid--CoA ligase [Streptomyces alkaliterrae]MBB1258457.1 fatty acid--CoA ligase [Streptomyces alkaliterrae]MQS01823.1 long-chain-fatty-acid--CoA ligase [Streptomyces alkaliterrae]
MTTTHTTPATPGTSATPATDRDGWTLSHRSARHARDRADHPAVRCEDRVVDYAALHRWSNRLAHALLADGVTAGARVAYLGRESEHYYALVLACAKAGAVIVPVNWRLTAGEVDHILRDSGAEVLFTEREFRGTAERVRAELPALRRVVTTDVADGPDAAADPAPERDAGLRAWSADSPDDDLDPGTGPDDAVAQIYTSGTTGLPKGVVLAQRSFFTLPAAMAEAGVEWIDWRADDVNLISLPGFGIAGLGWFLHGFCAGATNVVMRMFFPQDAVRLIETHGVTTTFAAPAMLRMMLDEPGAGPETFRSLRKIAYGAAPISEGLLRRSMEVFGCELAQIYASTETGSVAVCLPPEAHRPGSPLLTSAGRACPGNELRIVDREGRELPPGEIGQVCVRAPSRMLGYWNLPEATAATLVGEWLHMGDAGYLDADGYLFLCDRINDTIIAGGQNIYPAEVEKQLSEHPAVADCAVVGLPDPRWGEMVHAQVVLRPGATATPRELMTFLHGRIADYKIPCAYHFADALPRNPSGKVLRREVRDRLQKSAG